MRTKRTAVLTVTLLCAAVVASKEKSPRPQAKAMGETGCAVAGDEAALRKIPEEWKRNYNGANAAAVAALYTDDAYYLTQHFVSGIVHGREAIQAYVQIGVDAHYRVDSIEILAISCSGDMAYVIDRYTSTNAGQKAVGVNLVVLKKTKGRWFIVAQEAAVPDPATAIQQLPVNKKLPQGP
jgi:uncharacterized protein (TIGR02246 family)